MLTKSTWLTGLATIVLLSVSLPGCAQTWGGAYGHDRDRRGGYDQDSRVAYDNGYRRGMDRGERDGRDRRPMNFRDEKDYRNGDWGYDRRYGSRDYYRDAFRRGFEAGYSAGYGRYNGYGYGGQAVPRDGYPGSRYPAPNGGYGYPDRDGRGYGYGGYANNIAFQNGYQDGLEKGSKDWRGRKSYDLLRQDWYRDGDRHYKREYGPRDQYKDAYRAGFKQGYDRAYNGGGRY